MRYLTSSFAMGALNRGASIEQFLGPLLVDGVQGIRWVTIEPIGDVAEIRDHAAQHVPGFETADLDNLPPLYTDEERCWGWIVATTTIADALRIAHELLGAAPDRWVNFGVAGEDYRDYAAAGQSGDGSADERIS